MDCSMVMSVRWLFFFQYTFGVALDGITREIRSILQQRTDFMNSGMLDISWSGVFYWAVIILHRSTNYQVGTIILFSSYMSCWAILCVLCSALGKLIDFSIVIINTDEVGSVTLISLYFVSSHAYQLKRSRFKVNTSNFKWKKHFDNMGHKRFTLNVYTHLLLSVVVCER